MSRRSFIKAGLALGAAGGMGTLSSRHARLINAALSSAQQSTGSLSDIKHLVILMQENRSFDHYYGTMQGVRGFSDKTAYSSYPGGPRTDPSTIWTQTMEGTSVDGSRASYKLADGATVLQPFQLVSDPPSVSGQTTNDITHDWGPQHGAWNNGAMDRWMIEHIANDPTAVWQFSGADGLPTSSNVPTGITSMGYYRQQDSLAFYRALADAFTICDGYHCSVMGPTDPNRLMWMSGSLGAHSGDKGGVVLTTYDVAPPKTDLYGTLDWPTLPELLTAHGVSWKVYQDPADQALFNVLTYFQNFWKPSTSTDVHNAALGLLPVYPVEFVADVAAGTLPQVSWIVTTAPCCEHPATPPEYGEWLVSQILQTLVSNPDVWAQTVFLVVYDENGGFFDHVPPPTPGPLVTTDNGVLPPTGSFDLAGTDFDGEYVNPHSTGNAAGGPPSDWGDVLGPVGLGFRTPALVISPFSAGGWVSSDTFDHISTHKFIESLFLSPGAIMGSGGLHVSPWRYDTVGDFTSALPNLSSPVTTVASLPATSLLYPEVAEQALINAFAGIEDYGAAYPPPSSNTADFLQLDPEPAGFLRRLIGAATGGAPSPLNAGATASAAGAVSASGGGGPVQFSPAPGSSGPGAGVGPGTGTGAPGSGSTSSGASHRERRALGVTRPGSGDDTGLLAGVSAAGAAALAAAGLWWRRMTRTTAPAEAAPAPGPEPGPGPPSP